MAKVSVNQVVEYARNTLKTGDEEFEADLERAIKKFKCWELRSIAIKELDYDVPLDFDTEEYSGINLPIIVLPNSHGYEVMDGRHRAEAARQSGAKHIMAYVPC
jgi:ParB-like nuclease domain.